MLLKYYSTAPEEEVYNKLAQDLLLAEQRSQKLSSDLSAYSTYLTSSFMDKEQAAKIAKDLMNSVTDIYSCLEVVLETTEFLTGKEEAPPPAPESPAPEPDLNSPELLLGQLNQLQDVRDKLEESLKNFQEDEKKDLDTDK